MRRDFLQVSGENFVRNGEKAFLRGFAIGSWMNLEHFMMGRPGTDEMMKEAFTEVYGAENSRRFFAAKQRKSGGFSVLNTGTSCILLGYHL